MPDTVTFATLVSRRAKDPVTTAHGEIARFYSSVLTPLPRRPLHDSVRHAASEFSVWTLLRDTERLVLSAKVRERIESAARARVCALRGHFAAGCGCSYADVRRSLGT